MRKSLAVILFGLLFAGCGVNIPKEALTLRPDTLARRQLQTRRFDTSNELQLLQAAAGVLQDLGFNLDESESGLGLIAASKSRDATDIGQIIGAVVVGALIKSRVPTDTYQNIRASVVTRPVGKDRCNLRVTFQRTVYNSDNQISRIESLEDAKLYQEFFDKLSKSVFLQAHNI
ncbi:MAG: hypothetical protein DCC75_07820 [Proteobacteria bacterium]|nr:MAG: hypothetical protein DCC75_07820 [Pseudomonadota bacterium]